MANIQLISHKLIGMLAVCLAQILMQHDAVDYCAAAIDAIHAEKNEPGQITSTHNKHTQHKQQNESNTYTTHIAGKALGLAFGTEVEYAEHQICQDNHNNQILLHKF